jgi:tRNA dimethylallyltransferase
LRGAESGPPPNPILRSQLDQEAATLGTQSLHERLARFDPAAAKRIHPNDLRRIIRALEVFEHTGVPISSHQVHFHGSANPTARVICLDVPRPELYLRINERVVNMFRQGFVEEGRRLMGLPRPLSRTARQAVGYKEVLGHLSGERDIDQTIELVQRRTRQFAKRQLTWFRRIPECRWLSLQSGGNLKAIADTLMIEYFHRTHLPASDSCG